MIQNCPGYDQIPGVVHHAHNELKQCLWTLYWLVRTLPARNIVELGIRHGETTRALLSGARDLVELGIRAPDGPGKLLTYRPHFVGTLGAKVTSFDIDGDAYRLKDDIAPSQGYAMVDALWDCRKSDSVQAGLEWREGPVDLLFVDTAHTYQHTKMEIAVWSKWIRVGGIMAFHDTDLTDPGLDGVKPAIVDFLASHGDQWTFENHPQTGHGDTGIGWLVRDQ